MKFTSPVYSAVSGSVAGLTYAHNSGGMYARARATPTNPNTVRQQDARSAMSSAATYWHVTLTEVQRQAWGVYALNTPVTNPLGATIHLSGQNMFLRANMPRVWQGLSFIAAAPTVYDLGQPVVGVTSVTVAAGTLTWILAVGGAGTNTTGNKYLYVGPPQNVGRQFFKGPYQLAGRKAFVAGATTLTIPQVLATPTDWLSLYTPVAGNNLPVKAVLHYDDGRVATEWRQMITVL